MLHASGKLFVDSGVEVVRDGAFVGYIHRHQLGFRETYSAAVAGSEDQALLLAILMAIVEADASRGNASA